MKRINKWIAVLLAALFLMPVCGVQAEGTEAFTIDDTALLRGMDRSWYQGYMPDVSRNRWNLVIPVRSESAVGAITAELVVNDAKKTPFKPQVMTVQANEETKGLWGVRFALSVFPDQKNADYPCTIRLTGKDKDGNALSTEIAYVVKFRGAKESIEKAAIAVTEVQSDLSVGEEGVIRVTLTNPCSATIIENLELKMNDAAGHILPRKGETLKIGTLPIGESVTVEYPVTVLEKANVAPHVLKMDLNWTALDQDATYTVNNTVSISQEIRLEQGGIRMASSVVAGDSATLTLPLMNMGKADVVNVLATVSMPGITDRQSVLVGTIQPGETKQAQLILSPAKDIAGDFSGTITVECTDQDGNPASFELPVNLKVEKPVKTETDKADSGKKEKKEQTSPLTLALAGACGLLLILLILQGVILRRKLHRLEEDKL